MFAQEGAGAEVAMSLVRSGSGSRVKVGPGRLLYYIHAFGPDQCNAAYVFSQGSRPAGKSWSCENLVAQAQSHSRLSTYLTTTLPDLLWLWQSLSSLSRYLVSDAFRCPRRKSYDVHHRRYSLCLSGSRSSTLEAGRAGRDMHCNATLPIL